MEIRRGTTSAEREQLTRMGHLDMEEIEKIESPMSFENCQVLPNGLTIKDGLDFSAWQNIGKTLQAIHGSVGWWIGDWLNYGESNYGETYAQAIDVTGYDIQTLMNYKSVSNGVKLPARVDSLSWSAHREVAFLEPDIQKQILNRAVKDNLSSREIAQLVKDVKRLPTPELPKGKYNIIYADPAWRYFESGLKNQSQHYDTMELEDICKLPVADLAADNCLLFLWITFPILNEFMTVLEAWGFEYSTVGFVWVKKNKNIDTPFFGLGTWTRSNAEICIIARKGSIERKDASISQIIETPIGEHSEKPAIVRDKIVQLVGDLPRIELFARQKTNGWDTWGNQI